MMRGILHLGLVVGSTSCAVRAGDTDSSSESAVATSDEESGAGSVSADGAPSPGGDTEDDGNIDTDGGDGDGDEIPCPGPEELPCPEALRDAMHLECPDGLPIACGAAANIDATGPAPAPLDAWAEFRLDCVLNAFVELEPGYSSYRIVRSTGAVTTRVEILEDGAVQWVEHHEETDRCFRGIVAFEPTSDLAECLGRDFAEKVDCLPDLTQRSSCLDPTKASCPIAFCGDGIVQEFEQCDGLDLNGLGCSDLGYCTSEGLECTEACIYDPTWCTSC